MHVEVVGPQKVTTGATPGLGGAHSGHQGGDQGRSPADMLGDEA